MCGERNMGRPHVQMWGGFPRLSCRSDCVTVNSAPSHGVPRTEILRWGRDTLWFKETWFALEGQQRAWPTSAPFQSHEGSLCTQGVQGIRNIWEWMGIATALGGGWFIFCLFLMHSGGGFAWTIARLLNTQTHTQFCNLHITPWKQMKNPRGCVESDDSGNMTWVFCTLWQKRKAIPGFGEFSGDLTYSTILNGVTAF